MRFIALLLAFCWLMGLLACILATIGLLAMGLIPFAPVPLIVAYVCWKMVRICWQQAQELPR